ncbi:MAG: DUF4326 domain-containing protein [Phycisphaeraceae bacterium]|nr:DUF4326 domain-containing protein [Phycisphaeraceae bacterium]
MLTLCVVVLTVPTPLSAEEAKNPPIQSYQVDSPFQANSTGIRVLRPDHYDKGESYRVLYVLPVVANDERKYGGGLLEILKHNYHNTHQLICVAPEFTSKPWYADHSDNMGRQDESHLLKTVLPYIDSRYSTLKANKGRLLIGFSKSGWGAMTLLLRNPDVFYRVAAWDSGIRVDTGPIDEEDRAKRIKEYFGSRSNFEKHRISNLIKTKGKTLGHEERLFYYSTEGIRAQGGVALHRQMIEAGMPHRYYYETGRKHRWDSGWIPRAVAFLAGTTVVNLNASSYDVYIGRRSAPYAHMLTQGIKPGQKGWLGNPHPIGPCKICSETHTRTECIRAFKSDFLEAMTRNEDFKKAVLALKGKRLGCFFKPEDCHGDVIKAYIEAQ